MYSDTYYVIGPSLQKEEKAKTKVCSEIHGALAFHTKFCLLLLLSQNLHHNFVHCGLKCQHLVVVLQEAHDY